jgi:hypothetical protein
VAAPGICAAPQLQRVSFIMSLIRAGVTGYPDGCRLPPAVKETRCIEVKLYVDWIGSSGDLF